MQLGLRGDRLRLACESGDRGDRGARHEESEQCRERDPGGRDHRQQQQLAGEGLVDLGQRQRDGESAVASDARDEHADVRPVHVHLGEVLAAARISQGLHPASMGIFEACAVGP